MGHHMFLEQIAHRSEDPRVPRRAPLLLLLNCNCRCNQPLFAIVQVTLLYTKVVLTDVAGLRHGEMHTHRAGSAEMFSETPVLRLQPCSLVGGELANHSDCMSHLL
jgi:hypothetical protein